MVEDSLFIVLVRTGRVVKGVVGWMINNNSIAFTIIVTCVRIAME